MADKNANTTEPTAAVQDRGDVIYNAIGVAALGASAVALYFFVVDIVNGRAFYTPSLMGSVLFLDVSPSAVDRVSLQMVAYFSVVHLVACVALGLGVAWTVHQVERHSRKPAVFLMALFFGFEVGFLGLAAVWVPDVIAQIGVVNVTIANLLAAGAGTLFMLTSRWGLLRRSAGITAPA